MPDITGYYKLTAALRRSPPLHRSLKKVRRFFIETIPGKLREVLRVFAPICCTRLGPPKSSFSVYASPRYWAVRPNRVVVQDQGVPDVSSESLLVRSRLGQHLTQPWPIFWSHHLNARLVSKSLALLDDQKRICREAVYGDWPMPTDPALNYAWLPKEIFLPGKWTSIVSRWCPTNRVALFSHWLLDALPRLALLAEFPSDTGILVPSRLAGYQKESLKLLGLLDRVRYTPERHVVVEDYYFSSPVGMISTYNPHGVNFLRTAFLPKTDKSYQGPKRFVIQRKGKTRGILNDSEVNEYFKSLGWAILNTEDLTFAQELQLFQNAEAFAGVMGSGFTNAVWSSPGCKAIMFVPDTRLDGWAEWICIHNKVEFHWRMFPADREDMITVSLDEVKRLLAQAGLETK
jgi:hypothetical protein